MELLLLILAIIVLVALIFYISKKYDNEIKMLNKMVELNRNAIDENSKNIKSGQKKISTKVSAKEAKPVKSKTAKTVKKSTAKKSPAKSAPKA